MISHRYKCIFIHIPRTAGSSIENWICGKNWWDIDPSTKHLIASQARKRYSEYWSDYYKFSFVRNPWDRCVSCLKFPSYFEIDWNEDMDLTGYKRKFSYPTLLEHDFRFYNAEDLSSERHKTHCVYQNILDEELDDVYKFENITEAVQKLHSILKIDSEFNLKRKIEQSERKNYSSYYTNSSKMEVAEIFARDIERFAYTF